MQTPSNSTFLSAASKLFCYMYFFIFSLSVFVFVFSFKFCCHAFVSVSFRHILPFILFPFSFVISLPLFFPYLCSVVYSPPPSPHFFKLACIMFSIPSTLSPFLCSLILSRIRILILKNPRLFVLYGVLNTPVCEETFRAASGTLQSPANTGGRRQCTFIIEQWQGYVVHLQFTHFNLGDGSDNCQNTYLEVGHVGFAVVSCSTRSVRGTSIPETSFPREIKELEIKTSNLGVCFDFVLK